jgi:hypothetical protein
MATRRRNGTAPGNGNGHAAFDPRLVLGQAAQLRKAATGIARVADDVWDGAEAQVKSLDAAVVDVEGMAGSLT